MNVTLNQNLRSIGLDTSILKEVSTEILKRAQEKTANAERNVRFTAQNLDLGADLYQGRLDVNTAKQIALNNSGFQVQLNQEVLKSIQYLNTQAAQRVQKNVEGKIAFAVYESTDVQRAPEPPKFNSIISYGTSKDKQGSNPFYHGELLANKKEDKKEEINIFA